jgi:protein SCO1/2
MTSATQLKGIRRTVFAILVFIAVVVVSFVSRVFQPTILSVAEMQANGTMVFSAPRQLTDFKLVDHHGNTFTRELIQGRWTLVFFGFTFCPDVCPTTMAELNQFIDLVQGTEVENAFDVVMVTVDPARDTQEQLATYVPFFNPNFLGVTGEFLDIHRFATELNTPFRRVPGGGENYQMDHSANIVIMNPRGDYHGFVKAPLDLTKMKLTLRSMVAQWDKQGY